jgi:enoyl-[acyl-carrier protein] reductase I
MGLLDGKRAVVFGVANRRSIAWGIAEALAREGASLAITYESPRIEKMVRECADKIPGTRMLMADVNDDAQVEAVYQDLGADWDRVDIVIHSIAWAPRETFEAPFVETTREAFGKALEVSAYSLIPVTRYALPLMAEGGSVMAMTYIASERVFPHYNVMAVAKAALECSVRYLAVDLGPRGVRVNAISAGPISTLAARGIKGFTGFAKAYEDKAPLRRATSQQEVGDAALFLASDLSRGVTGEVLFVDQGYHVLGI